MAKRGINMIIVGRNGDTVSKKCKELESEFGVETKGIVQDLGDDNAGQNIIDQTKGLEVGMLVYNAGLATAMKFEDAGTEFELYRMNVNIRTALALVIHYSKGMVARKRGGIMLLSSTAGICGMSYVTTYSATKGYMKNLGEALWGELLEYGVDVISIMPGSTIGQNFSTVPEGTHGFMTGAQVVEDAYAQLGKYPSYVIGAFNQDFCSLVYDPDKQKEMAEKQKEVAKTF